MQTLYAVTWSGTAWHQAHLLEGGRQTNANVCGAPDQCPDHCKVYAVHCLPSCSHKWSQYRLQSQSNRPSDI